jgi:hypothetical protein
MTTQKVAILQVKPGFSRDGTEFASTSYRDGKWCRFQYGRPRKMGGYSGAFLNSPEISRGMINQSQNGITYVISGSASSVQRWAIANDQAIGTGPQQIYVIGSITTYSITTAGLGYVNATYTGISPVTASGNGTGATFTVVVSGNVVTSITATANGTGYGYGDTFTFLNSSIGGNNLSTVAVTGTAGQFSCASTITLVANQQITVTGTLTGTATGIGPGTYYVITGGTTTFTLSASLGGTAITTTAGTTTGLTFNPVTAFQGTINSVTYYGVNVAPSSNYYQSNSNTLWQWDVGFDSGGTGNLNLIGHPGINLANIDNTVNTRPLLGTLTGNTLTPVGVFTATGTTTSGSAIVTFATTNLAMGAGLTVTGTGIPASTTIVSSNLISNNITLASVAVTGVAGQFSCSATTIISGQQVIVTGTLTGTASGISAGSYFISTTNGSTTFTLTLPGGGALTTTAGTTAGLTFVAQAVSTWSVTLSANATASGTVLLTFDNNISVSGGVCMLFPYLFVYGNNGLIQNCSAGNFLNWTSADANANNVASTKIVKGMALRGGTTSPAGLFWSTDSVIRVSYAPQTVGTATLYWRYDLVTNQSSIMSSQCCIEYDGIIYWAGVDRFLMYNGVVQEVPNTQNLNWFFDGLNIAQRQKVWASKIPRWGEIWWFYPRGNSVECNDAIIYNVREQCWYDAGLADGANRSAGYFSEVFRKPIWAGNVANSTGNYTLWVQESGTNSTYLNNVNAIESYFETNVLGSNMGLVGNAQGAGENLWTRLDRVEPDFQQAGTMNMVVTGKGFADDTDIASDPYNFDPTTLKIDLKEQRREMRLRFTSNTVNGDYFMGRVVLNVETGDVRGTGNP